MGIISSVFEKGVGYFEGIFLLIGGKSLYIVIIVYCGLFKVKLFIDLDKFKKGKIFYIYNIKEVLVYKVD